MDSVDERIIEKAERLQEAYPGQQTAIKQLIEAICQNIQTRAPGHAISADKWPEIVLKPTQKPEPDGTK
jgi:hypothetical protein